MHTSDNLATTHTITSKVIWGFMLENTLFTEFEERNHAIIEAAYKQRKRKQGSHYIHIVDANLPKPGKAKVYFGVVQNHLRMPGTRYYVNRRVVKDRKIPNSPAFVPTPVSTNSTSTASSVSDACLSQLDPQLMALFSEDLSLLSPNHSSSTSTSSFQLTPDGGLSLSNYFVNAYPVEEDHLQGLTYQTSNPYGFYDTHFVGTGLLTDSNQPSKPSNDLNHYPHLQEDTVPWSSIIASDYFTFSSYPPNVFYTTVPTESFPFC
ncbi:hypothetical protein EDC96DRAFT_523859 [Choanephora cucurbitarum]|nr:hypothetical protein EDC96DRAFT_523859 [Choanephora cucurbitarum]